ncbi:MAG: cell division protein FtsA, partial [Oscillospiraceae bacterium]
MTTEQQDLIFALDIGTRSVIGVLGRAEGERFHVLAIEKEEHGRRAMLDGQIEDIEQVSKVARMVTDRLEAFAGVPLTRVCVAAAGRALR